MVKLAVGPETLRVLVQGEVHAAAVSLDPHGVPLVIVQQAAIGHRGVTLDGAVLIATWSGQETEETAKQLRIITEGQTQYLKFIKRRNTKSASLVREGF